ncbi:MAG: response regulator [Gemmatimonadales bacterium]|nr:response regulator [Gemmatimonadales bacterium]
MTGKARILVADDEPHIRRILQFLLEQEGFEVVMAENGEEAWKMVESTQPDLVLLDVMMPGLDGFDVLNLIREGFETRSLPVILLTAKGGNNDKVRGLKGGANDYVIKPFNHDELLLRVTNLLEATRREREANPLTGLPGNRAIEREVQNRIEGGSDFGFMYIDIDRFKSFNDHYGYSRGDRAISFLAGVLVGCSRKFGSSNDFIGHVGGDDFVLAAPSEHVESLAFHIIEEFDSGISNLHDREDFEKGYLAVKSRSGKDKNFPLITLTVAIVNEIGGHFEHPAQLSDTMAELKRYGKTMNNSVVVKERRNSAGEPELVAAGADFTESS